jgi:hypothetical protein
MPDRAEFDVDITLSDAAQGWGTSPIIQMLPASGGVASRDEFDLDIQYSDPDEFDLDVKYNDPNGAPGNGPWEANPGFLTVTCAGCRLRPTIITCFNTCLPTCAKTCAHTCANTCRITCAATCFCPTRVACETRLCVTVVACS